MEPSGAHTDTVRRHNKAAFDQSLTGPPAEDNCTGRLPRIRPIVNSSRIARVGLSLQPGTMRMGLVREPANGRLRAMSSLGVLLNATGRLLNARPGYLASVMATPMISGPDWFPRTGPSCVRMLGRRYRDANSCWSPWSSALLVA